MHFILLIIFYSLLAYPVCLCSVSSSEVGSSVLGTMLIPHLISTTSKLSSSPLPCPPIFLGMEQPVRKCCKGKEGADFIGDMMFAFHLTANSGNCFKLRDKPHQRPAFPCEFMPFFLWVRKGTKIKTCVIFPIFPKGFGSSWLTYQRWWPEPRLLVLQLLPM